MKTKIMSFSGTEEYDALIAIRAKAAGITRSAHLRKCVREEAERAAANHSNRFQGVNLSSLIATFSS